MSVLLDCDILIEVSRGRDSEILTRWAVLAEAEDAILYSPVTEAELWAGVRPREYQALTDLLGSLVCVSIDKAIGRRAGEYLKRYGKSHGVELADALIASAAVLNEAKLWTRNRKHYPMTDLTFY
ncbi:MAG: type II toxin-antitoxin system VapC family toxin [Candidatus Korobacteraceae bacterium]